MEKQKDTGVGIYNRIVGVGVIDISDLGLKKNDFVELYRLEFEKGGKKISSIAMLTPNAEANFDERIFADHFREFNSDYVVMYEDGYFFEFGQKFYDDLSKLLF